MNRTILSNRWSMMPSMTAVDLLPPFSPRMFVVPAVVSVAMLIKLWWDSNLFGRSGAIFVVWFVVAAIAQFTSRGIAWWSAGLVAQTVLAIVLVLRGRVDDPLL
jgi:hypothetical protein